MSVLEITVQPTAEVSHFATSVLLDGQRYKLAFYTNKVDQAWYLDINEVVFGVGLSVGVDLLYPYRYLGDAIPPGILWVVDKGGLSGRDPDLTAFVEKRASLYYLEAGS